MALAILLTLIAQTPVEPEAVTADLAGKRIVVNGVYGGQVGSGERRILKLQRSNAKYLPGTINLDHLRGKANVEIEGTVRMDGLDVVVDVDKVRLLPSDGEIYDERAAAIRPGNAEAWYALSRWARSRAEKYASAGMQERSAEAYKRAVAAARKEAEGDAEKLRAVLRRARDDERMPLVDPVDFAHEILLAERARLPRDPEALRKFAAFVQDQLVGPTPTEVPPLEDNTIERYKKDPLATFRDRSSAGRRQLGRFLQVSALEEAWKLDVEAKRMDALSAGEAAAREAPDYPLIASRWAQAALEERFRDPGRLSKRQVETDARRIAAELKDPKAGRTLMMKWLGSREEALWQEEEAAKERARRQDLLPPIGDAQTRLELAEIYGEWFPNDPVARDKMLGLLREAVEIDPSLDAARRKLALLDDRAGARPPAAKIEAEPREPAAGSPLQVGMTTDLVRRSSGEPDSIGRAITRNGVREQWVYRGVDGSTYLLFEPGTDGVQRVAAVRTIR